MKAARIKFSSHARYQIKQRNISRELVIKVVSNPDKLKFQEPNRVRAFKKIDRSGRGYILVVIYEQKRDDILIITAFVTSKTSKYS